MADRADSAKDELSCSLLAFDDELRSGKQKQRPAEAIQVVRGGRLPLLLSACHAAPHTRLNRTKAAERTTPISTPIR